MSTVTFNGIDLTSDLSLDIEGVSGWNSGVERERIATTVPGRIGVATSDTQTVAPRVIEVQCRLTASTVASRDALLDTIHDRLRGEGVLAFSDQPDKYVVGELYAVSAQGYIESQSFVAPDLAVALRFFCPQPAKLDTSARVVGFDSTAGEIAVGTEPHWGIVELYAATDPTITVTDWRGVAQVTFGLTGTIASGDAWELNLESQTLTEVSGGVRTRNDTALAGDAFFGIEPTWADRANEVWPTISVQSGNGRYIYRRRWSQ